MIPLHTPISQIQELTNVCSNSLAGKATNVAAGTLVVLAAGGALSNTAIGSAVLGEIGATGIAGSALSFASSVMTPLAVIAAPFALFSGISASMEADNNLYKANAMYSQAQTAVEKMKLSMAICDAIKNKAVLFENLLSNLNFKFIQCSVMMENCINKKRGFFNKKLKSDDFTEDEIKLFAVTRSLAGAIKSVLDTPILNNDGNVNYDCDLVYNHINSNLSNFDFDVKEIQSSLSNVKQLSSQELNNLSSMHFDKKDGEHKNPIAYIFVFAFVLAFVMAIIQIFSSFDNKEPISKNVHDNKNNIVSEEISNVSPRNEELVEGASPIDDVYGRVSHIKNASVLENVLFGTYDEAPVEWIIVFKYNGLALLMAEEGYGPLQFSKQHGDWENSKVRSWLNGEFFEKTFSPDEAVFIVGNTRILGDEVFILSSDEFNALNIGNYDCSRCKLSREAKYTAMNFEGYGRWWLRDDGSGSKSYGLDQKKFVTGKGIVIDSGYGVDDIKTVVRPAIWVRYEKSDTLVLQAYQAMNIYEKNGRNKSAVTSNLTKASTSNQEKPKNTIKMNDSNSNSKSNNENKSMVQKKKKRKNFIQKAAGAVKDYGKKIGL